MSIARTPDVSELRARMDGQVLLPGDAEWDVARADNYRRARRIKAAVDPTDPFRPNHPIPPAEARPDRRPPLRANRPRVAARRSSPTAAC